MKEDSLINLFSKIFSYPKSKELIAGVGDDCAVIDLGAREYALVTVDEVQEGTHFLMKFTSPSLLASKLVRMNVSDIYSMGDARPLFCFVAGGLPRDIHPSWVKKFSVALKKESSFFGMKVAGGNLCRSDKVHFSMTVIGLASKGRIVYRKGTRVGDIIASVGFLGDAKAGVEILLSGKAKNRIEKKLVSRFWRPYIRHKDSRIIASYASAMLDNSDGLYKSLSIIAKENKVGVDIKLDKKIASPELISWCEAKKKNWREYVCSGGEDYGLIFSMNEKDFQLLKKKIPDSIAIGKVVSSRGIRIEGYEKKIETFEHF